MANPSNSDVHPARLLTLFGVLLIAVYLLVFLTGDKQAKPNLGIDLQGGTTVTLRAQTPDGTAPSDASLKQAQTIIENRVNGLGVGGSEVVVSGSNLVITVPGQNGDQARALGQTARLYIRPVTTERAVGAPATPATPAASTPAGSTPAGSTPAGSTPAGPAPTSSSAPAPSGQNNVYPRDTPTATPSAPAPTTPGPTTSTPATPAGSAPAADLTDPAVAARVIAEAKKTRQSTVPATQQAAMAALDCTKADPLAGNDDPKLPLVTCDDTGTAVYLLEPSLIDGQEIANATSGVNNQSGQNVVNVEFKSAAGTRWANYTGANIGKATAFTLDTKVLSAPVIQSAIPGGNTEVSGRFTADAAQNLANALKYGSLPLSFKIGEAQTISATLGYSSLRAGLIAGLVGLVLVLLYALAYYRALGVLTALSLLLAGVMVYGILVLLGRWIGYSLDLSGIAGLVIGIGMTADSFVVYFERIKDEIRDGRTFRSAVPRGWARARRTIWTGNAVTLLAAAVLYVLAVGDVRGFAFTLGLTTILDIVIVFLVTHPLVHYASRTATFSKPQFNGLGAVARIGTERRHAAAAAPASSSAGNGA